MGEINALKSIAGTTVALGITFSLVGSNASTINNNEYTVPEYDYSMSNQAFYSNNQSYNYEISSVYIQNDLTKLESEAQENFGVMRDATKEELESVNKYIYSIAKETGLNFFDLC